MKKGLLLLVIFLSLRAVACTCSIPAKESVRENISRLYGNADTIFVGNLVDIEILNTSRKISSGDPIKYTFEVTERFKGTTSAKVIEVYSARWEMSCGFEFSLGQTYLVHYRKDQYLPKQYPNLLSEPIVNSTGLCSGNKLRKKMSKKNLRLYRRWYVKAKALRPFL